MKSEWHLKTNRRERTVSQQPARTQQVQKKRRKNLWLYSTLYVARLSRTWLANIFVQLFRHRVREGRQGRDNVSRGFEGNSSISVPQPTTKPLFIIIIIMDNFHKRCSVTSVILTERWKQVTNNYTAIWQRKKFPLTIKQVLTTNTSRQNSSYIGIFFIIISTCCVTVAHQTCEITFCTFLSEWYIVKSGVRHLAHLS